MPQKRTRRRRSRDPKEMRHSSFTLTGSVSTGATPEGRNQIHRQRRRWNQKRGYIIVNPAGFCDRRQAVELPLSARGVVRCSPRI